MFEGFKRAPYLRARVGEFPECWMYLYVFDLDSGEQIRDVIEVDCSNGLLIKKVRNDNGRVKLTEDQEYVATERLKGNFGLFFKDGDRQ